MCRAEAPRPRGCASQSPGAPSYAAPTMQAGHVGGGGGERFEPAGDFAALAAQVARLDERTLAMQRQLDERFASARGDLATLRAEVRTLVGGLYAILAVGFTVVGWLVTRAH